MSSDGPKSLTNQELWKLVALQSTVLLGVGWLLSWWSGQPVRIGWPALRDLLLSVALVPPLLLSSFVLLQFSEKYVRAVELLERVIGPPMRGRDIPLLAVLSAVVEEFFFRGVLQPILGLAPASLVFGLAHVWNRHLIVHGLWAAVAGLYLGAVYQITGNLA